MAMFYGIYVRTREGSEIGHNVERSEDAAVVSAQALVQRLNPDYKVAIFESETGNHPNLTGTCIFYRQCEGKYDTDNDLY
jgi:hypothetical protein